MVKQTTHDCEKTDAEIITAGVEFFEGYADRTMPFQKELGQLSGGPS